jgi:hypothetical protein
MNADRSFDVRAQPSVRSGRPIVEHFSGALQAMERHAEIANTLRDAGWRVAARTGERQIAA